MPRLAAARHDGCMSIPETTTKTLARPGARLAYEVTGDGPAVVLVHGYGYTLREVAALTGIRPTTVQNHLSRGLARLRLTLGVRDDDRP